MGQILAIVSSKGGVGKTTTAVNLAAAFASLDFPTLLVEADPQCSLVSNFGFDQYDITKGISNVARNEARLEETTFETPVQDLHVVSSNIWTQDEEIEYLNLLERDPLILKRALEFVKGAYDYVVIDAPPMLGPITIAVLAAADRFIVPIQSEPHAIRTLARLMDAAEKVRSLYNENLRLDGIALTMVDSRTRLCSETSNIVKTGYPDRVFSATIPRSVKLAEVPQSGRPISVSAPSSRGGRAYTSLAEEILLVHARERALIKSEELGDVDSDDLVEISRVEPGPEEEIALALINLERGIAGAEIVKQVPIGTNGSGHTHNDGDSHSSTQGEPDEQFVDIETFLDMESGTRSRAAMADGDDSDGDWSDE